MSRIMKRMIAISLLLMSAIMGLAGAQADGYSNQPEITDYSDLSGKTVSMLTGAPFEEMVRGVAPDVAEFTSFNSMPDMLLALKSGKTDAALINNAIATLAVNRNPELALFPQNLRDGAFGFAFAKGDPRRDAWQAAFDAIPKAEIQAAWDKWTGADGSVKVLPEQDWPGENGTVRVAACDTLEPMSYAGEGGAPVGFDLEVIQMIARALDVRVEFTGMEFSAILSSVQAGKADIGAGSIIIPPERAESVDFVEYYPAAFVLIVRAAQKGNEAQSKVPTLANLEHARFAVQTGSINGPLAEARFPEAEVNYFNSQTDSLAAFRTGKVDAWITDEPIVRFTKIDNPELTILDGRLSESNLAAVFPKTEAGQALCDQYSAFIEKLWADGTMAEIDAVWFGTDDAKYTVLDYESLPATNGKLRMAADLSQPPFSYIKDNRAVGYDVDIAARFCKEYGYALEIVSMSFDGILASVQSGKCDFSDSCITITEERAESVLFSAPNYYGGVVVGVWKGEDSAAAVTSDEAQEVVPELADLEHARAAVQTGTICGEIAQKVLPDIKVEYYNTQTDCLTALQTGKVDFWPIDEPIVRFMMIANDDLRIVGNLDSSSLAAVFPKTDAGQALCDQYSAFVDGLWADGTMAEIDSIWFGTDEDKKTVLDYQSLPDTNGTLRVAVDTTIPPFVYVKDNEPVGYDIDISARFCEANGYRLEVVPMDFGGMLPSVQTGKCDFAACAITITEERAQSVLFSSPTYHSGTVAVVKAKPVAGSASAVEEKSGFMASFEKTFLREDRWKLFADGVLTTLLITLLAILFGTALGFLIFMLCRNGNPVANLVTRFCLWLVQGMPMVVLLMILYYIVFGNVAISGIAVAVIGFTLTFGASVFGLLKMGVGAVDNGQYEAAYALGFSNRRTFFEVILPQALPHVMPAYRGEIVGLIKATAIVGYIAVQDLTKMGDIVRSRTYEAFFPLIAVTVIYFILEELIGFVIRRIGTNVNPKRRSPESILKGVKTDD